MSMTLKKGQKAFKPKFAARRAPSSARPSVEPRLSQTPTPATRPNEHIAIPDQDGEDEASQESSIVHPTPQGPVLESQNAQQNPAHDPTNDAQLTDDTLKRRAGGEPDRSNAQKRPRIDESTSTDVVMSDGRGVEESSSTHTGDDAIGGESTAESTEDLQPSQNETAQTVQEVRRTAEDVSASQPTIETNTTTTTTITTSTEASDSLPDPDGESIVSPQLSKSQDVTGIESQNENAESRSRRPSPEVRQDNPMSVYPDPELSGVSLVGSGESGIRTFARLNPDGTAIVEIVPTFTINPDGTAASNVVPAAALNPDGTPRELAQLTKTKKRVAAKRRRLIQAAQADGEDVRPTIEMQVHRPRRTAGAKRTRKKKDGEKPRKKRGQTPEDGENTIIDPGEMTMADLCKDLGIGAKSTQHERMKQKNEELKQKAKERKLAKIAEAAREAAKLAGEEVSTIAETVEGSVRDDDPEADAEPDDSPDGEQDQSHNPQMRLVDGRVVLDQSTLTISKQQIKTKSKRKQVDIVITEDDFSRIVTSGTHMQREPAQIWDARANATFYKGLSMFGYDFEMIAKMFPGRNRRQIKLKYAKEERDHPWKIKQIMNAKKVPIDMDDLREYLQEPLAPTEEIDGEIEEMKAAQRQQEEDAQRNREEIDRLKRAAIQQGGLVASQGARTALESMAEDDGQASRSATTQASVAPKPKPRKTPKRPKKNIHGVNRNMEESRETIISRGD